MTQKSNVMLITSETKKERTKNRNTQLKKEKKRQKRKREQKTQNKTRQYTNNICIKNIGNEEHRREALMQKHIKLFTLK